MRVAVLILSEYLSSPMNGEEPEIGVFWPRVTPQHFGAKKAPTENGWGSSIGGDGGI